MFDCYFRYYLHLFEKDTVRLVAVSVDKDLIFLYPLSLLILCFPIVVGVAESVESPVAVVL